MVKRKVARIGPSTLMISLPSKWCKHFNIQKGAELDVEEQGSEIKIRVNENKSLLETTVDISNLGYRTGKWTLGIPFTAGYDLINVNHEENQKDFINSIIREEFIGFIISEQNDNKTVFKKVTMESEEEFDALLRRVFLLTIDLSQKVVTALNESKPSALKNYLVMEKTNNQLDFFRKLVHFQFFAEFIIGFFSCFSVKIIKIFFITINIDFKMVGLHYSPVIFSVTRLVLMKMPVGHEIDIFKVDFREDVSFNGFYVAGIAFDCA